jgi:DNA-binding MarR family transcriptional regulator
MTSPTADSPPTACKRAEPLGAAWVELIHELSKSHRQVRDALGAVVGRWNLNDTEFLVLWMCERNGPRGIAQNALASAVGASAARISGLVENLRERGLLTSHRSQRDRRRQMWQPTADGLSVLRHVYRALSESHAVAGASISLDERRNLYDLLRRLAGTSDDSIGLALFTEDTPDRKPCTEAHHENAHRRAV